MDAYEIKEWQEYRDALLKIGRLRPYGKEFKKNFVVLENVTMDFIRDVIRSFIFGDYYIAAKWEVEYSIGEGLAFNLKDENILCHNWLVTTVRKALALEFSLPPHTISNWFVDTPLENELVKIAREEITEYFLED